MKVKLSKFLVLGAVLAASVSLAGIAYADSVSGTAWEATDVIDTIPCVATLLIVRKRDIHLVEPHGCLQPEQQQRCRRLHSRRFLGLWR